MITTVVNTIVIKNETTLTTNHRVHESSPCGSTNYNYKALQKCKAFFIKEPTVLLFYLTIANC